MRPLRAVGLDQPNLPLASRGAVHEHSLADARPRLHLMRRQPDEQQAVLAVAAAAAAAAVAAAVGEHRAVVFALVIAAVDDVEPHEVTVGQLGLVIASRVQLVIASRVQLVS